MLRNWLTLILGNSKFKICRVGQWAARARAAPFPGDARALRSVWDAHSLLFISQSNFEKNCVSPACRAVSVHSVRGRLPSPPDAHLSVCPLQGGDEASYTLVRGASDALSDPELSAHQAVDGTHERRRTRGPGRGPGGCAGSTPPGTGAGTGLAREPRFLPTIRSLSVQFHPRAPEVDPTRRVSPEGTCP